ncbi:MAG TPA: hypothetical protein VIM79_06105 [Niastella sp.]
MNTLELRWDERKARPKTNEQARKFLDFLINGKSLLGLLNCDSGLISPFGWAENKVYEKEILKQFRLQKPSDLETGRIMLYVCAACGDISCGAITFSIKDLGDRIQWLDFGSESDFGEIEFINFPALIFDRQQYFKAFTAVRF